MELAEQPPTGPAAPAVTSNAYEVRATLDLGVVYDRLQSETTRLLEDFSQQGLTGQELADAVTSGLKDLSDMPVEQAGRGGATEAFNLGRNLAMQDAGPVIGEVVRTAILDLNTCDPCDSLDGFTTTVNGPGYLENMPPNKCDGGDLCRCFYMARAA
jgi:hypothetical protein